MQELDLIHLFDQAAARFVLVATYEFDPEFFERRLMRLRGFEQASRIVIFMDAHRYSEIMREGFSAAVGFNRRYLVVPVRWGSGVFHPKLYLLLGKKEATLMVASANCTSSSIAHNLELCNIVRILEKVERNALEHVVHAHQVIRTGYELFRSFTQYTDSLAAPLEEEVFRLIELEFPWLDRRLSYIGSPTNIEFLHGLKDSLWQQIIQRLDQQEVRQITIVSPFYDQEPNLFVRLKQHWPTATVSLYAQPEYANLPAVKVHAWAREERFDVAFHAIQPKKLGRSVHAKALAFETASGTFWLVGSANFTSAALDGKNFEACLWFQTKDRVNQLFRHDNITVKAIKPEEFIPGNRPAPEAQEEGGEKGLTLTSAILSPPAKLTIQFQVPPHQTCDNVRLLITNIDESSPCISYPLTMREKQSVAVHLTETQMSLVHKAVTCQIAASLNGQSVTSPPVALVQLGQLFREREDNNNIASPLRRIEETGEGLVEHLDSLEDFMDVIHFLQQCSIRFDDGEPTQNFLRQGHWRPRNPFSRKGPAQWADHIDEKGTDQLRQAIWDFVERHQRHKLARHRTRGNLNGLHNFFDIFRTLNALLCAWHLRRSKDGQSIIPVPYVIVGIKKNLYEFLGIPPHSAYEEEAHDGYLGAIQSNLPGAEALICTKLQEERVPEMLVAALQATQKLRAQGVDKQTTDWASLFPDDVEWLRDRLRAVGIALPTGESVAEATAEYEPISNLAA